MAMAYVPWQCCGNCKHFEVLYKSKTGRPQKGKHGQCNAIVQLIKPIAYEVTISRKAVWADTVAHGCPTYEQI